MHLVSELNTSLFTSRTSKTAGGEARLSWGGGRGYWEGVDPRETAPESVYLAFLLAEADKKEERRD